MIKAVIRLKDDSVLVFNDDGEQLPEYQGQYQDVRGSILRDASPGTVFNHWFRNTPEPDFLSRESW